jgi:hypothetical protein
MKGIEAMDTHEDQSPNGSKSSNRRRHLEFFYFEKQGSRYVLRVTRLTVILIVGLTLFSVVGVLVFSLINIPRMANEPINANISTSPTPLPAIPIIKPPSPRPMPPIVITQPRYSTPTPSTPTPDSNLNEQIVPNKTPQPQASKPPG